ncbi:MAG: NAD(+)--dinitrogen-reductase ADP-D-ribosyltransferase [Halothiobacillaceae bacterium]|nr:NAD(+)--dinitrogen-reductase ADP-D-ribosyltransferase [Halothiobacillaceae bacterium]
MQHTEKQQKHTQNTPDEAEGIPDNSPDACRGSDKPAPLPRLPRLPRNARLPINRCNLPADVLGGLTFQRHPAPLLIDGVLNLHRGLFERLDRLPSPAERGELFLAHMDAHFCLTHPIDAGADHPGARVRANWRKVLQGWSFDSESRDGALLKGWVESRFGLLPRHHREPLPAPEGPAWTRYLHERSSGLYATNALEAQIDLLYAYTQHELTRAHGPDAHLTLYRGVNALNAHDILARPTRQHATLLLNNLSAFSASRERADEFGDTVLTARIPTAKILAYSELLPGLLRGEAEYLVIGGLCEVEIG